MSQKRTKMKNDRSHALLCRSFELRAEFEDIMHDLTLPKNRRELTVDFANWFLKHGATFNKQRVRYAQVKKLCEEYLEIYNG
jgi:hypothetical protein